MFLHKDMSLIKTTSKMCNNVKKVVIVFEEIVMKWNRKSFLQYFAIKENDPLCKESKMFNTNAFIPVTILPMFIIIMIKDMLSRYFE